MMPHWEWWGLEPRLGRREFLSWAAGGMLFGGLSGVMGCRALSVRPQSPDEEEAEVGRTTLIGDLTVAFGMHPIKVESVALVTGLPNTGSDPPPSPERAMLLDEMQKRGVTVPHQVLASSTTELVLVRGYLRPGIQTGDTFDIEVRVPTRSGATSLRGGWLMETRLKELAVTAGQLGSSQIREGRVLAVAKGPVLVDPLASGEANRIKLTRGRVLGGGTSLTSRPLGLVLKPDYRNVLYSAEVGNAVNRRFHTFDNGIQKGVAKPKDDEYIELVVHPRYKYNIERYMQVIRAIAVREPAARQAQRLETLSRQLLDAVTAGRAALRLEAIGKDGIPVLRRGLESADPEVRFHSAQALAYLDVAEAVPPLVSAAREEPAFRAYALAALSAMHDYAAYEGLTSLLSVSSAETRYGAFRSLWFMDPRDPLVRGEMMGDQFHYHVLDPGGPPMIHLTRSFRPEVVLFGRHQALVPPLVVDAGGKILVHAAEDGKVTVSRYVAGEPDQKRVVSTHIDELIRAMVDLGATYPDVVQVLAEAKAKGALEGRLEIDALPEGGRRYERRSPDAEQPAPDAEPTPGTGLI
ncbi:MAG: flagellar basal body P-ring protein FlgI [Pirellulales bacterium]|nr:flagellar basal body P-ring protein FlgI [Pirellulales bacterium]